jgi:hypothetical protein
MDPILSQPNPVCPIDPHLIKVHLNVILPPTPRSSQRSLTFGPPNQNPVNTSPSPTHATCTVHLILLDLITLTILGKEYRLWSSLCSFLHDVFLPFRSKYPPQNPVLKNLSLCSSLKARDQVLHSYSTIGKTTALYILIFNFFYMWWEDKRFCTKW